MYMFTLVAYIYIYMKYSKSTRKKILYSPNKTIFKSYPYDSVAAARDGC